LSDDWKLQSRCLQTKFLPEDHTGEVLADSLEETLSMWELAVEFQVCVTQTWGSKLGVDYGNMIMIMITITV